MVKYTAQQNARTLALVSLLVLVSLLSACAGGANQVEVDRQDDLLSNRESALDAQPGVAKAAAAAPQPQAAALSAGELSLPAAPAVQDVAQETAPQQSAPLTAALAAPAQPVTIDSSLPVAPRVGARAPQFTLNGLDGQPVNMDALIGHPVVISYWATWCIPCQQELPILQKLYEEYAGSGLVVLTVNAIDQDSLDKVQAMLAEKGMNLPVLLDEGGNFANDYQALFFPTTYYIDPAGVIRFIKLGDSTEQDLREHVDSLMKGEL